MAAAAMDRWDEARLDGTRSPAAVPAEAGDDQPTPDTPLAVAWGLPTASGIPLELRAARVDRCWPQMGDSAANQVTSATAVIAALAVTVIAVSAMAGEGAGAAVGVLAGDSAGALAGILSGPGRLTAMACGGVTTAITPTLIRRYLIGLGKGTA